jgi:hypothetical protein
MFIFEQLMLSPGHVIYFICSETNRNAHLNKEL